MPEQENTRRKVSYSLEETLAKATGHDVDPLIANAVGTIIMGLHYSFPAKTIMRGAGARNVIEGQSPTASLIYAEAKRVLENISDEFYENNPVWKTTKDRFNEPSDNDFRFAGKKTADEFEQTLSEGIEDMKESDEFKKKLNFTTRKIPIYYDDQFIHREKYIYKVIISNNEGSEIVLDLGYHDLGKSEGFYDRRSGWHSTIKDKEEQGTIKKQFSTDFTFPMPDRGKPNFVLINEGIGHFTNALRVMTQSPLRGDAVDYTDLTEGLSIQDHSNAYQAEAQQYLLMLAVSDPALFLDTLSIGFFNNSTLEILNRLRVNYIRPENLYTDFDLEIPTPVLDAITGIKADFDPSYYFPVYDTNTIIDNLDGNKEKPVDRLIRVLKQRNIMTPEGGYEELLTLLTPLYPSYATT